MNIFSLASIAIRIAGFEHQAYIKKTPGKGYCVKSPKNPDWSGGCYPTKGEAQKRLQQVEMFKSLKGKKKKASQNRIIEKQQNLISDSEMNNINSDLGNAKNPGDTLKILDKHNLEISKTSMKRWYRPNISYQLKYKDIKHPIRNAEFYVDSSEGSGGGIFSELRKTSVIRPLKANEARDLDILFLSWDLIVKNPGSIILDVSDISKNPDVSPIDLDMYLKTKSNKFIDIPSAISFIVNTGKPGDLIRLNEGKQQKKYDFKSFRNESESLKHGDWFPDPQASFEF